MAFLEVIIPASGYLEYHIPSAPQLFHRLRMHRLHFSRRYVLAVIFGAWTDLRLQAHRRRNRKNRNNDTRASSTDSHPRVHDAGA